MTTMMTDAERESINALLWKHLVESRPTNIADYTRAVSEIHRWIDQHTASKAAHATQAFS